MGYEYDSTGVTFNYFLISVVSLVLIPLTFSPLLSRSNPYKNDVRKQKYVKTKNNNKFSLKWFLIAFGWFYLAFLTHRVLTTEAPELTLWDPYKILGIDDGSSLAVIKKKYRKLSLKFHPDKIRGVSEEEAAELNTKYVEITKAYKALTDDDIRKNYEEYGHPDGRQSLSLGIALPIWLVEAHNNIYVLSVYGLILGLFLPYYVGRWWYHSLKYTRDKILNRTMAIYFKDFKSNYPMKDLIDLMSASKEFSDEIEYKHGDEEEVKKLWAYLKEETEKNGIIVEESRKYSSRENLKAAALIQAHFNRVNVNYKELKEDQLEIIPRALSLVYGLTQIALAQNWIHSTMLCIELSQMIVQAVPYKASPLLQLPNLNHEIIRSIKGQQRNVKNVFDFMKLEDSVRRKLLTDLSDTQYKEAINAGLKFPVLKLKAAYIKVIGDQVITPGAILTCVVKLKLSTVEEELKEIATKEEGDHIDKDEHLVDDEDSHVRAFLTKSSRTHLVPPVYSPYFPEEKQCNWWVVIGDLSNGRMLINPTKVSDLVDETSLKFQFQGPGEPGNYSFNLFIKSDSYLGVDIRKELDFTVEPDTALPEESEIDDEISEPEVGSFADQLNEAQQGNTPLNDDMTSSDEE